MRASAAATRRRAHFMKARRERLLLLALFGRARPNKGVVVGKVRRGSVSFRGLHAGVVVVSAAVVVCLSHQKVSRSL